MLRTKLSDAYKFWVDLTLRQKIMIVLSSSIVLTFIMFAVFADFIVPYDPIKVDTSLRFLPPSPYHFFGTDHLGRDVFSRVIYSSKTSLTVSLLGVMLTLTISVPLGLVSAFEGGKLDRILTFLMDSLYVFPRLVLTILFAYILGKGVSSLAIAIALANTPSFFRVVRSIVATEKERLFVESSRALGGTDWHIIRYCIFPSVRLSLASLTGLAIGNAILSIASLGFLGIGFPPPTPEWGTDLAISREFLAQGAWWTIVFPGLAIVIVVFGFLTLGETLSEIFTPKLRER
jgi:peptide/nickel transport system permease protein